MSEKELWILMKNEKLNAEKVIYLYKSNYEPKHPWSVLLENIISSRTVRIYNVANSFEEGMVIVRQHLEEANRLGYIIEEKRF